jgi:predicted DNA-binding protein
MSDALDEFAKRLGTTPSAIVREALALRLDPVEMAAFVATTIIEAEPEPAP